MQSKCDEEELEFYWPAIGPVRNRDLELDDAARGRGAFLLVNIQLYSSVSNFLFLLFLLSFLFH